MTDTNGTRWKPWGVSWSFGRSKTAMVANRKFAIALLNVAHECDPAEVLRFARETVGCGNDMFLRLVRPKHLARFAMDGQPDEIGRALKAEHDSYQTEAPEFADAEIRVVAIDSIPFTIREAERLCNFAAKSWVPISGDEDLIASAVSGA